MCGQALRGMAESGCEACWGRGFWAPGGGGVVDWAWKVQVSRDLERAGRGRGGAMGRSLELAGWLLVLRFVY
jgi:hypothetical protein